VGAISSDAGAVVSSGLGGGPQGSVFDRLKLPVHDRLGPSQSGLEKKSANTHTGQTDLVNRLDQLSSRLGRSSCCREALQKGNITQVYDRMLE
jgi:hypothetical protein